MTLRIMPAAIALAFAWLGCKEDGHGHDDRSPGHSSQYPTCDAIIKACHPLDVGDGPIHDCHDLGHGASSDADCAPKKEECLRLCVAGSDAGG